VRIEDGLVVFLALATGGVLLAGLARALDARPRAPHQRRRREPHSGRVLSAAADPIQPPVADLPAGAVVAEADRAPGEPFAAEAAASAALSASTEGDLRTPPPSPEAADGPRVDPPPPDAPAEEVELAPAPAGAGPDVPVIDVAACLGAYEAGDHAAAESAAVALAHKRTAGKRGKRADGGAAPLEQVALWSALALCRRARGDEAGAAAALERGTRWARAVATRRAPAPGDGRAPRLGRDLLAAAEAMRDGTPARHAALRLASTWLGAAAAADPGDGDAAALAARAGDGFAEAVTAEVAERIARRDFAAGHEAIEDALAGVAVPEPRRGELRDLPWTAITGEVSRLIGQALHGVGETASGSPTASERAATSGSDGADGMAALTAAARVVAEVPPDALTPQRHQDLERRLWWAHLQLGGELRVRGELDGAVTPLIRALELAAGDPPREAEAREAVALVIEALAVRLGQEIRQRLRVADVDAAMAASRRLGGVVDDALSRGLSPADLAGALARRQEVLLELVEGRPA